MGGRSDGRGAHSVHHQWPSDASCDRPASSAQAGTTPSRSETHVGTWRCAGDSRGTTAPCVGAQLVRCGGGGGRRGGRSAPRWFGYNKFTKLDPMASCHPYTHLLVKIKPRDVFLGKGQQKPTWRRALARCEGVAGGRRGTDVRRHGEQMSYVPKLIHSQADSFTGEFKPGRRFVCGYAPQFR